MAQIVYRGGWQIEHSEDTYYRIGDDTPYRYDEHGKLVPEQTRVYISRTADGYELGSGWPSSALFGPVDIRVMPSDGTEPGYEIDPDLTQEPW